jgi:RHS repeat-associated protein
MQYDALGNIHSRSDIAGGVAWTYDSVHVHQVVTAGDASHTYSYDNTNGAAGNGNVTSRNGNAITWTSYNYPSRITNGGEVEAFLYGPDRQRYLQTYIGTTGTESTSYVGDLLEKSTLACGVTAFRHYVYAGGQPVAIVSRKTTGYNAVNYVLQDHLGGTAAYVDGLTGKVRVQESFGAYGLERSPADWSSNTSQTDAATIANISRRGFTFHTSLGQPGTTGAMGLIHMNGRVADAVTGRFLSADPTVSDPGNTQSFNRYSYVQNNPLTYADPSGFILCKAGDANCHDANAAIHQGVAENAREFADINAFFNATLTEFDDGWDSGGLPPSSLLAPASFGAPSWWSDPAWAASLGVQGDPILGKQSSSAGPSSAANGTNAASGSGGDSTGSSPGAEDMAEVLVTGSPVGGIWAAQWPAGLLQGGPQTWLFDVGYNGFYGGARWALGFWQHSVEAAGVVTGIADGALAIGAARGGESIVLGLRDFGTRELADRLGATHLLDHPEWMSALQSAIRNPGTKFTVNLEGFSGESIYSQVMGAVQWGLTPAAKYTEWEMAQLYQAGRLGTVNFVNKVGEVLANPF